ncbi:MAG: hypothetical protein ACRCT2_12685, partial [Plesiomonas shigelloides]
AGCRDNIECTFWHSVVIRLLAVRLPVNGQEIIVMAGRFICAIAIEPFRIGKTVLLFYGCLPL